MKTKKRPWPAVRRLSYLGAIVIFVVLMWAVGRLVDWGWPPFLTEDFDRVVPWIRASLAVDIAFNAVFLFYDRRWFMAIGDSVRAMVNAVVAIALLRVFPFDFSPYDFNWETLTRIVLILAIIGAWIAAIVGLVRAVLLLVKPPDDDTSES